MSPLGWQVNPVDVAGFNFRPCLLSMFIHYVCVAHYKQCYLAGHWVVNSTQEASTCQQMLSKQVMLLKTFLQLDVPADYLANILVFLKCTIH